MVGICSFGRPCPAPILPPPHVQAVLIFLQIRLREGSLPYMLSHIAECGQALIIAVRSAVFALANAAIAPN